MKAITSLLLKNYKVLLVLVLVLFLFFNKSKAVVVSTVTEADKDNTPNGWTPNAFTEQLHAVMQDWFALRANEKEDLWREMAEFTDGQLKMVYNYFNTKFSGKIGKTLTEMIDSEIGWAFASINSTLVKRLRALNLN
jgi:hypothetical protein